MQQILEFGWMGGTYNPTHIAHLVGAQVVAEQFGITELVMGPNGIPPHKSSAGVLHGHIRLRLLQLSIEGSPLLRASSIELDRALRTGQPSFTVDTLAELTVHYDALHGKGNYRLSCVVGEDVVPDFKRWRDADGIKKLARIIIIPRYSQPDPTKEKLWRDTLPGADVAIASGHAAINVSSTSIRTLIKAGSNAWRFLVREKVYEEIVANGYYLNGTAQSGTCSASPTSAGGNPATGDAAAPTVPADSSR